MSKLVIDSSFNAGEIANPVKEMRQFLTSYENQILKAINGNEPGEIRGTSVGGINFAAIVITDEIEEMNGGKQQQEGQTKRTTAAQG